jgi:hypothetical protein
MKTNLKKKKMCENQFFKLSLKAVISGYTGEKLK